MSKPIIFIPSRLGKPNKTVYKQQTNGTVTPQTIQTWLQKDNQPYQNMTPQQFELISQKLKRATAKLEVKAKV